MATAPSEMLPPVAPIEAPAPAPQISRVALVNLGQDLDKLFKQYASDRRLTELKWLRNLRQYKGIYDPEIDGQIGPNSSRAYPRITRAKCISVLSRIMNLMFPGNERNWELKASPNAEIAPNDVRAAVQQMIQERQAAGLQSQLDEEMIQAAVQRLADKRAEKLSVLIDDQLQELGGDQTCDYVLLNRKVADSGIKYGVGYLHGPFVREEHKTKWVQQGFGSYAPQQQLVRKPHFEFRPVWDVYTDMSAKTLPGDGYFVRMVMSRSQLRKLADRPDFMADQIKTYLKRDHQGNYKEREFESELRSMGTAAHVNVHRSDPAGKYEVIMWNGPISTKKLQEVGADVPEANLADDIEAEVWLVGGEVIKANINQWRMLGCDVQMLHAFCFDEDDTSPIPEGLPYTIRDSQMSIAAATRMTLDNAAITCGPNLEINTALLRTDQDLSSIVPYKLWYRDDDQATAQFPAVRNIEIQGHLQELRGLIELFMQFADLESFVGPATGGDVAKTPSEPMRTAAGASMLRGDAALPFKDIVRNFDSFTQSVILSLVKFNRKFNPQLAAEGDYDVIARGATSLIAKEVRGMQLDMLAQTLTPEERDHVDERKFVEQRLAVRDMTSLLVPEAEAKQRKEARSQQMAQVEQVQMAQAEAERRKTLADALKGVSQAQKNTAAADAQSATATLDILERGSQIGNESGQSDKSKSARS